MLSNFGAVTAGTTHDKNALRRSFLSLVDEDDTPEISVHGNGKDMSLLDCTASTSVAVQKIKCEDLWEETTSCGEDAVSEFSQSTKSSAWHSEFELSQKSLFQSKLSGNASLHVLFSGGLVPADGTGSPEKAALRMFQHHAPAAQVPSLSQVAVVPPMLMKNVSTTLPVHPLIIKPPPGLNLPKPERSAPLPGLSQAPPGLSLPPPGLSLLPQSAPCDEGEGMLGHPELCARPCIFFAQGSCANGNSCGFCHLLHPSSPHLDKRGRILVKTMKVQDRAALIISILEKKAIINGFQAEAQELLATLKARMQPNPNLRLDSKLVNLTRALERLSFRSLLPMLLRAESTDTGKDKEVAELVQQLRRSVGVSLVKK